MKPHPTPRSLGSPPLSNIGRSSAEPQTLKIASSFSSRESSRGGGAVSRKKNFSLIYFYTRLFLRASFFFFFFWMDPPPPGIDRKSAKIADTEIARFSSTLECGKRFVRAADVEKHLQLFLVCSS